VDEQKKIDEKDEKEVQKHDEKVEERDTLSSVVWGLILVWAGLVFLASNQGWLEQIGLRINQNWAFWTGFDFQDFSVWNLVALGAGAIVLVEALIRLLVPSLRRQLVSTLIGAAILIGLGLGGWLNWAYIWPFILIAIGFSVLIQGLTRTK
jgi:hypothetical protein